MRLSRAATTGRLQTRAASWMQARGGGTGGAAEHALGSGRASLPFEYTVRVGDTSPGLRCANESVLSPVGGIRDLAGNAADLGLPEPGPLHGTGGIVLDTAPRVANVTSDTRTASTARERASPSPSTSTSPCGARATRRAELDSAGRRGRPRTPRATARCRSSPATRGVRRPRRRPGLPCRGPLSGDIAGASGSAANRTLPPLGSPLSLYGTSGLRLDVSRPSLRPPARCSRGRALSASTAGRLARRRTTSGPCMAAGVLI